MSELRSCYGAAVALVAATGAADNALTRVGAVALVDCFSETAGVRRVSRHRQRDRNKSSDKREEQQESGDKALHVLLCESEPQGGASIKQNPDCAQAEASMSWHVFLSVLSGLSWRSQRLSSCLSVRSTLRLRPVENLHFSRKKRVRNGAPGLLWGYGGEEENGWRRAQALPLILAHHQRTPTNRNRQSLKNSGGLPSKAWPMNWRIHPITKSPSA